MIFLLCDIYKAFKCLFTTLPIMYTGLCFPDEAGNSNTKSPVNGDTTAAPDVSDATEKGDNSTGKFQKIKSADVCHVILNFF